MDSINRFYQLLYSYCSKPFYIIMLIAAKRYKRYILPNRYMLIKHAQKARERCM